jgi:hypothetical protein
MKLHQLALGFVSCLSLTLAVQAQTTTLDWTFSRNNQNPSQAVGYTNAPATFVEGNNRWMQTGPEGIYGTANTGLWSMERSGDTAPKLELKYDQTPVETVDLTLVITHFVDNAQFPGTVSFSIPGVTYDGRQLVTPQEGSMIGAWYADTWSWTGVGFPLGGMVNGAPISLYLFPGGDKSLLLDEVKLSIFGAVATVPEPMAGQLAGLGLVLFGLRSWLRRKG